MKITTKKVTRETFITALNIASKCMNDLHPRTRLANNCKEFMDENKLISKKHNKESKKLTSELERELRNCRIDNALEKDGKLLMDEKGNYQYGKAGEKLVLDKQLEVNEKIEEIADQFLLEEIEIKCIVSTLVVPDTLKQENFNALNGFVFQNKNEFEEEKEEVTL